MIWLVLAASVAVSGVPPCTRRIEDKQGEYFEYIGDRDCVVFEDPGRTYHGIWVNEFEGSRYYDKATSIAQVDWHDYRVWFSTDEMTRWPNSAKYPRGHAYRIVFEGRQALDMKRPPLKGYGHMSMFPGLVLADRIISIEDLGTGR
jgi:hypothetical protein